MFHNMTGISDELLKEPGRFGDRRRAALELLGTPEDAAAVFAGSRCKVAILIHASRNAASLQRVRAAFKGRLDDAIYVTSRISAVRHGCQRA